MNCAECTEQMVAHVEGLLDQLQQSRVESHLVGCPTCQAELDRMRHMFDRLVRNGQAAPGASLDPPLPGRLVVEQTLRQRRMMMKRITRIAIAAAVLIGAYIGLSNLSVDHNGNTLLDGNVAFAEMLQRIENAKTLDCTHIHYAYDLEKGRIIEDGKSRWMFREPRQMRRVRYNDDGSILFIWIEDFDEGTKLVLWPKKKTAVFAHKGRSTAGHGFPAHGPIDRIKAELDKRKSRPLGKKTINGREAYGFTHSYDKVRPADPYWRPADFWIDAKTKEMILYQIPGPKLRLLRAEEARTGKLDAWRKKHSDEGSKLVFLGEEFRDIVYDSELDDSLFSFDVPEGYTVETHRRPEVTEKDMIEWLKVAAECFENTFPDDPSKKIGSWVVGGDRMGKILRKGPKGLTSAEKKLYDLVHMPFDRVYQNPVERFAEFTAGDSWHYAGKGVTLGDKTAIVCWYKPTKDSKTYRVVYGDLSVKDVAPEDLPSQAEP